jgi:nucleotide-binding universal stress UspA family protein
MTVKTILVPLDFSETSARVLDCARTLADAWGASLHLMHVIGYPVATSRTAEEEQRDAGVRLESLLNREDRERRHATTSCEIGTPVHEIVTYASEHPIDLIVMGTHWHGPTFQMAAGSIAESVLGLVPCAVLAVKGPDAGRHEIECEGARERLSAQEGGHAHTRVIETRRQL